MFSSCSRTPEQIISRNWGINVNKIEHRVDSFKDKWYPNGDGECEVKMHIVLSDKDLEQLVSQGAQPVMVGLFVCLDLNVMPGSDRASHSPCALHREAPHPHLERPVTSFWAISRYGT